MANELSEQMAQCFREVRVQALSEQWAGWFDSESILKVLQSSNDNDPEAMSLVVTHAQSRLYDADSCDYVIDRFPEVKRLKNLGCITYLLYIGDYYALADKMS